MDRDTVSVPHSQLTFIDFVVAPLYKVMAKLIPELTVLIIELGKNRDILKKQYDKEIEADTEKTEEEKLSSKAKVKSCSITKSGT